MIIVIGAGNENICPRLLSRLRKNYSIGAYNCLLSVTMVILKGLKYHEAIVQH